MDDLLSDGEVSALLSDLDMDLGTAESADTASAAPEAGVIIDEQGRKIKTYDFNRPNRFSKDHMRTMEMLHEIFSRGFTASVAAYLRTVAEVKVVSVTQQPFREYTMSLPRPDCIWVLKMEPLEGSILWEISPELVLTLIDRILGGPGKAPSAPRELTDIEQSVSRRSSIGLWTTCVRLGTRSVSSTPSSPVMRPPRSSSRWWPRTRSRPSSSSR
jgi:flagellar motor switch protein FliM